jgi:hypothetical protein
MSNNPHTTTCKPKAFRVRFGAVQECCPVCLGKCRCARVRGIARHFPNNERVSGIFGEFVREGATVWYHVSFEDAGEDTPQAFLSYFNDDLAYVVS